MPQWKQFSGNWTVTQQMQARGGDEWPTPPGAPTIGTATAGNQNATVTFTAPANLGVPATITQYTVTSSPGGITATGTASPIVVSGLTAGTAYTFTVTATNATGTGPASAASNSVTPFQAGQLWAWGNNEYGIQGRSNTQNASSPIQVGSLTTWRVAFQVNGNGGESYGINDNNLFGWGRNDNSGHEGTVGDNTIINRSSPVQIGTSDWVDVTGNVLSAAAIQSGKLYTWGGNLDGQLGQNDTIRRSSPTQVGALTDWKQVSMGNGVAAIKTNGTLWTWGFNGAGQLGRSLSPAVEVSSPVQVGALTDWSSVSVGQQSVSAIKTNGTLWTWGDNQYGTLGHNDRVYRSSPVQVGALTTWLYSSTGEYITCAIKTDGTLWTWGRNFTGGLGQNDRVDRSSPTQVGNLTNWKTVVTLRGDQSVAAIKTDGTLWMWGANNQGQLGDNTNISRSSPVQIGALTTWIYASPSTATFAIKTG